MVSKKIAIALAVLVAVVLLQIFIRSEGFADYVSPMAGYTKTQEEQTQKIMSARGAELKPILEPYVEIFTNKDKGAEYLIKFHKLSDDEYNNRLLFIYELIDTVSKGAPASGDNQTMIFFDYLVYNTSKMSDADFKVLKEKLATLIDLDKKCPESMCKKLTSDELLKLKTYYESNIFIKDWYDTVEKALKENPDLKKELPIPIPRIRIPKDSVPATTPGLGNAEVTTQTYPDGIAKSLMADVYDGKLDATIFGKLSATPKDAVHKISPQSSVSGKVQDLIKDEAALRTMIRDEILKTRNSPESSTIQTRSTSLPVTDGLKQGSSYSALTKDPSVTCPPPIGGCGKYIRKDSIPCWGCSLK